MTALSNVDLVTVGEVIRVTDEFNAHVYTNKQLQTISTAEENEVYRMLIEISSLSFGANQTKFWNSKREEFNYLRGLTYFVLVEEKSSRRIVAWTGIKIFKFKRLTGCYMDSSGIIPEYHGKGIVPKANAIITKRAFLKRPYFDFLLFTRTENPVIYNTLVKNLGFNNVYPRIDKVDFPKKYQTAIDEILSYLKQSHLVDTNSLLIKNAYGYLDELYGELPKCSNESINTFFHSQLAINDAFLIMGVLNLKIFLKTKL